MILLPAALGLLTYGQNYNKRLEDLGRFGQEPIEIKAVVTDYPEHFDSYSCMDIRLQTDDCPNLKARLYSYGDGLPELTPGDTITATVKVKSADTRYGESYFGYLAEDTQLLCYLQDGKLESVSNGFSLAYWPKTVSKAIKDSALRVFDRKGAPFLTGLLTGDKTLLYKDEKLYSDMGQAGILHVIAVSGMHVAFLVGFIRLLVKKKRASALVCIPLVWLFVPVAGASASVVRAAFMQSSVLIAPLLKRENDGLTSLSAVLAILLIINPYACASISLQLSFAAMLGIIIITPRVNSYFVTRIADAKKDKGKDEKWGKRAVKKLYFALSASVSASVGAIVFSTPISVLHFGYVPLYGIIVNVLIFWAVSLCFVGGYIACILGLIWQPMGLVAAVIPNLGSRYIIAVTKGCAALPYASVYTGGNVFGIWLAATYLVFILFYVFKGKNSFRPVLPTCITIILLCGAIISAENSGGSQGAKLTAVDVGQGQCIIFTGDRETIVIDCGGGGKTANAGEIAAGILLGQGRRSIDLLALTHFDTDHCNGVTKLMSKVSVKRLAVPPYEQGDAQAEKILQMAENLGVEVYIILEDAKAESDGLTASVFAPVSNNDPCLMYLISAGDYDVFISGDANIEQEKRFVLTHELPDCELYVAGHHGSKHSGSTELLEDIKAETAIISCGRSNNHGHPSKEAMDRLQQAGMSILRTDRQGSVIIPMNMKEG